MKIGIDMDNTICSTSELVKFYSNKYKEDKSINDELPVMYNINIGHAYPTGILPLGIDIKIDFNNKKIVINENIFDDEEVK